MARESVENETAFSVTERSLEGHAPTAPPASIPEVQPVSGLIDLIVERADSTKTRDGPRLPRFLATSNPGEALREWFGHSMPAGKDELVRRLNRDVAHIDRLLNRQINAILHHQDFQRLEASWRGLEHLTERAAAEGDTGIKIKVLDVSWRELERDVEHAVEFDQSELFRKVYEQEFGTAGGEPFGVLIADYEIHPRPTAAHPHDDILVLRSLAGVAAGAFCPLITNASPTMLGMDTFDDLEYRVDHHRTFSQANYLAWRSFRDTMDARFVGVTLPHVLMRLPYADDGSRADRFQFREDVSGPDRGKYLWGGAAFALGEVLIRAFAQAGWLADIRGVRRGEERGGLVAHLPVHCFATDRAGIAPKSSTDVIITDELEKQMSELGFVPLCHCKDTEYSAFYSNQSVQLPKQYDRSIATVNARISSMLQYMFCVSRFAHYVKVIGRDATGSFKEASDLQRLLHNWIHDYVTADSTASTEAKARRPLREARVSVENVPGSSGTYRCTMHLCPHYELDEVHASVRLVTFLSESAET